MTAVSEQRPTGDEPAGELRPPIVPDVDEERPRRNLPSVPVPAVLREATWRFWLYAPLLVVMIVAAPLLAWKGFDILRNEETGTVQDVVTDPAAPGFEALVTPTPTALLVDIGEGGALAGVTLLTVPTQEGGGNVMFFPIGTVVEVPLPDPTAPPLERSLDTLFAEGGITALEQRIETLLGAGINEIIEVPAGQWAQLVAPVAPLTVQNPSAVQTANAAGQPVSFPEGEIQLTAEQVGLYLQARADDEADTVRLTRHEAFWTAWLAALDEAGADAVPGEGEIGIGGFVRGLTGGPRSMETLPADPVPVPGLPPADWDLFRPRVLDLVSRVPDIIPFPQGVGRLRTRLVMGVEDQTDLVPEAARVLVRGGAEVSVIANDEQFDEEETVVYYFRDAQEEKAQRLLDALGTGRLVKDTALSDTVDVVIVLGQDYVDLVGGDQAPATSAPTGVSVPPTVPFGETPGEGIPTGGVTPGPPGGDPVG